MLMRKLFVCSSALRQQTGEFELQTRCFGRAISLCHHGGYVVVMCVCVGVCEVLQAEASKYSCGVPMADA